MKADGIIIAVIVAFLATIASPAAAQPPAPDAAIWREFAATLQPGAAVSVRLAGGQRLKATLLQVSDDGITIQPRTRVPVAPQQVAYADIRSIELQKASGGVGIGKAIAIGVAVGAGAFVGLLMIALAAVAD